MKDGHTHIHKDRNSADLTEAEDIKKRGQEYKKCTKKILMTQITTKCDHSPRDRHPGV